MSTTQVPQSSLGEELLITIIEQLPVQAVSVRKPITISRDYAIGNTPDIAQSLLHPSRLCHTGAA